MSVYGRLHECPYALPTPKTEYFDYAFLRIVCCLLNLYKQLNKQLSGSVYREYKFLFCGVPGYGIPKK